MAKVFVSYSRKDIEFAKRLTGELQKSDLDFWIDWEGIPPTVDWWREIEKGIEEADVFLFLISPDSAKSKICGQEIDTAVKNGKRIIPIVVREIEWQDTPSQLGHLNYIFFSRDDDFDTAVKKLMTAIQTDYEWAATHRRLQVKALEWGRENKENSYLLRGRDLQDAELDLATNTSKDRHPTDLQREFVFESRKATDRQRRTTTSIAIGGVVVLAVLAVVAVVMAVRATRQATISRSGELVAQSSEVRESNFQLSILLGIKAFKTFGTIRSQGNLLDLANGNPLLVQFLAEHTQHPSSVAFSPNGKILAYLSCNTESIYDPCTQSEILLWDVGSRKIIGKSLRGQTDWVTSLAFSPDGNTLASGSCAKRSSDGNCAEGEIMLWNVTTHQSIDNSLRGHNSWVSSIAFSPDGKILASASRDATVILWDLEKRTIKRQLPTEHSGAVHDVVFSPDGRVLISNDDFTIVLWDVESGLVTGQSIKSENIIDRIALSPDGNILAAAMFDGTIILWDVEKRQKIGAPLIGHTKLVTSLAFSSDGHVLASGSSDQSIIFWDINKRQVISQPHRVHANLVRSIAFSPDNKMFASASDDTIGLWDVSSVLDSTVPVELPITEVLQKASSYNLALSPDGTVLAVANDDGTISFWNMETHQQMEHPIVEDEIFVVTAMIFSSDGKTLVLNGYYADNHGAITLWDVDARQRLGKSIQSDKGFLSIALSPNSKTVATANENGTITLWDVATHQPSAPLDGHRGYVTSIAFSPNGRLLASGYDDGTISVWDLTKDQPIDEQFQVQTGVIGSIVFSPDGKILASASNNSTIILSNVVSHEVMRQIPAAIFPAYPNRVLFTQDGNRLISSSSDYKITEWDVETGQSLGQPLKAEDGSSNVFSPEGTSFASSNWEGTVIVWDMKPQSWISIACQRAGRNFTRAEWDRYFSGEDYPADAKDATCPQWPLDTETNSTTTP